jgi:hypothetical protein
MSIDLNRPNMESCSRSLNTLSDHLNKYALMNTITNMHFFIILLTICSYLFISLHVRIKETGKEQLENEYRALVEGKA